MRSQVSEGAGVFVILPDANGILSFDSSLAYALQRALDSVRVLQGVRGVSAAVLVPGQGLWEGVSGISSRNPTVAIDSAMLFGIGSNTKAFVSTTILRLVDAGILHLDDSLSRWLPPYPNITPTVTLRQLMNMTSGLFDYLNDSNEQGDSVQANPNRLWAPEELITTFVGPPHRQPGGPYSYCNTDYVLLGLVIKNAAGASVSSQIRDKILAPLGLTHSYLEVEESHTEPIAHPWDSGVDFSSTPVTAHFSTLWTAGGMISTAGDMARWVKALYEGQLLSPSSLNAMLTFIPMSSNAATGLDWNGYGLGVRQGSFYGKRVLGHAGAVMGYISMTGYLPQTRASFAILINSSEGSEAEYLSAFLHTYLQTIKTRPAQTGGIFVFSGGADGVTGYSVDRSTGALSTAGQARYGTIASVRLHAPTGTIWGLAYAMGLELVKIDGATFEAYPHVSISFPAGAPGDIKGMAFSPEGRLYVGSVDGRIYTVDTTSGVATLVATTGLSISGLAFDPSNADLWASIRSHPYLRDRLYKISLQTGDTIGVGNTGFNQPIIDLDFDGQGNLYGLVGNPSSFLNNRLALIDRVTAKGTEIGSMGRTGMQTLFCVASSVSAVVPPFVTQESPCEFAVEQNYPNPFNPTTTIEYSVGRVVAIVRLAIYDVLGREVAVLVNERRAPGSYTVNFDASGLAAGVYLYRLKAGSFVQTRKMALVK